MLPPAVAGIGLIVAFGRVGLLGSTFDALGINVSFNQAAVVLAISLVAGPFYVRQAIASFEAVDTNLIAASRTLGAGSLRTFFQVTLPLARGGLAAGEAICLARGLGEFGATIMFAGSLQGATQTLPLAVYTSSRRERSRRRARDQRAARDHQPRDPARPQGDRALGALAADRRVAAPEPAELVATLSTTSSCPCGRSCSSSTLEIEGTVALVGPSGAGKTSVLRCGRRARAPAAGRIALDARRLVRLGEASSSASPTSGGSASSSRSTRSSRT